MPVFLTIDYKHVGGFSQKIMIDKYFSRYTLVL